MIKNLDELTDGIVRIYQDIEVDLIKKLAEWIAADVGEVSGSMRWMIKKLEKLGVFNAECVKLLAEYSGKSRREVLNMLKRAKLGNIDSKELKKAFDAGKLKIDPQKIINDESFGGVYKRARELDNSLKLIRTTALESVRQSYMDVLNRAYTDVSSGAFDYNTAISRALTGMAQQGITGATYVSEKGTIRRYSIESAVRRDTLTAVNQEANAYTSELAKEIGATHVEVSAHMGARVSDKNKHANHAGWQGKIYKIDGSDKYPNLAEETGYPDDILGLAGVNCRHRMYPFIPDVSTPTSWNVNQAESDKLYRLTQKQRAMERGIRKTKKVILALETAGQDTTEQKKLLKKQYLNIIKFCDENGLERDFNRERIAGE